MKPTYKELLEMSVEDLANLVVAQGAKIDSINEIKAKAIEDFKSYVKSGLKVLNEPTWEGKRPVVIGENTYFEITLSEFDDYADKLRGEK